MVKEQNLFFLYKPDFFIYKFHQKYDSLYFVYVR